MRFMAVLRPICIRCKPGTHLAQNIQDGILTRGSFLYDEVRFVLQQELREPRNYFAILEAIAAGKTRLNEIKQATGIDGATGLPGYLAAAPPGGAPGACD